MQAQGNLRKNSIKLRDLVMISVGGMVGSAVFTLSGPTYLTAGPAAVLTWVIAAGILTIYALNLAELGSCYNVAGGTFSFPAMVVGRTVNQRTFVGWIAGWGRLWDCLIAISFTALYVSQYLSAFFPGVSKYQVLIAVVAIVFVCVLNAAGIGIMGRTNDILTVFLVACCAVFIVFGWKNMSVENFVPFFGQGTAGTSGVFKAIPVAMLGYGCIIATATAAEEVENPRKNIPKAIFIGIGIVTTLYVLMLIATYGLVPWQDFLDNPAALYSPQKYAVETALPQSIWLCKLISLGALLALFTTLLILCMDAGRTIMVISRAGLLPGKLGNVNPKTGTPVIALIVASAVGIILSFFPQFAMLICTSGAMTESITIAIIALTVIIHRRKGKAPAGSFRAPGGFFFPVLTIVIICILLTQYDPAVYLITGIGYGIGLVLYLIAYCTNRKNFTLAVPEEDSAS